MGDLLRLSFVSDRFLRPGGGGRRQGREDGLLLGRQRGERPADAAAVGAVQREPLHRQPGQPPLGHADLDVAAGHHLVQPLLPGRGGLRALPEGPDEGLVQEHPQPVRVPLQRPGVERQEGPHTDAHAGVRGPRVRHHHHAVDRPHLPVHRAALHHQGELTDCWLSCLPC